MCVLLSHTPDSETGLYLNKGITDLVLKRRTVTARPTEKGQQSQPGEGWLASSRGAPALRASPAVSAAHFESLAPASSGGPQPLLGSQKLEVERMARPGC